MSNPERRRVRFRFRTWLEIERAIPVPTFEVTLHFGRLQTVICPFSRWAWTRWGRYDFPPKWREQPDVFKWGPIIKERNLGPVIFRTFPLEHRGS